MEHRSAIAHAKTHVPKLVFNTGTPMRPSMERARLSLNTRVAVRITKSVGSMWCGVCVRSDRAHFRCPRPSNHVARSLSWPGLRRPSCSWSCCPIIIVGQNVQAAASDAPGPKAIIETLLSILTLTSEVHGIAEQQTRDPGNSGKKKRSGREIVMLEA